MIYLQENRTGLDGEWLERWHVKPPDVGVRYVVIQDEWSADYSVRDILEIEVREPSEIPRQYWDR